MKSSTLPDPSSSGQSRAETTVTKDYYMSRDGQEFAGIHLLLDLVGAKNLDNKAVIEHALRQSADIAGATLLHIHLHQFTPNGISGVAVLAESHISFHSWPDKGFAALDVFMCGNTHPHKAIDIIQAAFEPEKLQVTEQLRGLQDKSSHKQTQG